MKGRRNAGWIAALVLAFLLGWFSSGNVRIAAQERPQDEAKFHEEVAHALLEMHEALDKIAEYHAKGVMPANREELHETVAHGFKRAHELLHREGGETGEAHGEH